jgi:DNA-binding response OmpR family regulator
MAFQARKSPKNLACALAVTASVAQVVLVVEDDASLRELLEQALHREGFAPFTAPNGAEALSLLRAGVPAKVIVLELFMPIMDGWAFRKAQRGDPRLAHIPVIVTSIVEEHSVPDLDADSVFLKPLDLDQLMARVRTLCAPAIA